jgi:hypothetical protein
MWQGAGCRQNHRNRFWLRSRPQHMAVNGEEFRYSARPSALDTGSVHAVLGGINAAAKFEIRKFVPVWLLQCPTAVEKLCRRK